MEKQEKTKLAKEETGAREQLEHAKRGSVGQVLMRCARLVNEEGLERVSKKVGVRLRPAHTALFPHIDLEGTRLTTLAERMGVSKQAVGQLVEELVSWGVLERVVDPEDRRARKIHFVGGAQALMEGLQVLGEVEGELAEALGVEDWQHLRVLLVRLLGVLEHREISH
ncbi:MAG: MarR family transcriptional regulator [Myxococcales bacterium]|nr:MarR family transcriptional regulator [Myxococcales bacterium]